MKHPQRIHVLRLSKNPTVSRLANPPPHNKPNSPLKVNKVAFSSHLRMDHSLGAPLVSCVV